MTVAKKFKLQHMQIQIKFKMQFNIPKTKMHL